MQIWLRYTEPSIPLLPPASSKVWLRPCDGSDWISWKTEDDACTLALVDNQAIVEQLAWAYVSALSAAVWMPWGRGHDDSAELQAQAGSGHPGL
jgi:hypothetical protein